MKSIEELQADLKQLYAELEERKRMEQEATAKTVNFHEISSKAERYKMEGHPMSGRDEHEQAMYLLLLLSVAVMDDTVYETSFSLLYRIAHGMGFKGDVQELFVQAVQINFERIDEITRLFIKDDVRLVMLMECMMLAQSFKKEYKKAMEYVAELCILMKLEKKQITMISNIARAILMQDVKEYHCDIMNTYSVFNCYLYLLEKNKKLKIEVYGMPNMNMEIPCYNMFGTKKMKVELLFQQSNQDTDIAVALANLMLHGITKCYITYKEGNLGSYIYETKHGWTSLRDMDASYVKTETSELFKLSKGQKPIYFRKEIYVARSIDDKEVQRKCVSLGTPIAVSANAPNLAYAYAIQKYKEAGGIIE